MNALIEAIEKGAEQFSGPAITEALGLGNSTLRGWKTKGKFEQGKHYTGEGEVVWTIEGVKAACERKGGEEGATVLSAIDGRKEAIRQTVQAVLDLAQPHPKHDWVLTTAQLAEGCGLTPSTIGSNKANHSDELVEGTHWFTEGNANFWTKAGAMRMGLYATTAQGKAFRDMAEDLMVGTLDGRVHMLDEGSKNPSVTGAPAPSKRSALAPADAWQSTVHSAADAIEAQVDLRAKFKRDVAQELQSRGIAKVSDQLEALGNEIIEELGL